jgi:hypothetical protein
MLQQTERLEQTETTEKENEFFDIKELKTLVISAFDKEIQNKTQQKEKNRSRLASVLAGAGRFEPATHGFGVGLKVRKAMNSLGLSPISTHFHHKTLCRKCV